MNPVAGDQSSRCSCLYLLAGSVAELTNDVDTAQIARSSLMSLVGVHDSLPGLYRRESKKNPKLVRQVA